MTMLVRAALRLPAILRAALIVSMLGALIAAPAHAQPVGAAIAAAQQAKAAAATADAKATTAIAQSAVAITGIAPAPVAGVVALNHPVVSGIAPPRGFVTLYLNGAAIGSTFADAAGAWSVTLPAQQNGTFTLLPRVLPTGASYALTINDPNQPLNDYLGQPASFDLNNAAAIYYANGASYGSGTALLAALNATVSGITAVIGPVYNSGNLLTNGTFDTNVTGWTAQGSATIASVGGQLQFTVNATGDSVSQLITGYAGRALAFTGTGAKGTSTSNTPAAAMTLQNAAFGGNNVAGTGVSASTQTAFPALALGTALGANTWVGVKGSTNIANSLWDDFVVREAIPFTGWAGFATSNASAAPAISVVLDAVTPAALPTTGNVKVLWQGDSTTERDRIRIAWAADGHVHASAMNGNSALFDFDFGTIASATRFRVTLAATQGANGTATTGYAASLNGADAQTLFTSTTPMIGIAQMRIGRDVAGASLWDGTINQVAVTQGRAPTDWLEYRSALPTQAPEWQEGDSYMDGAGGVFLKTKLDTALGRPGINSAVGGSTFAAIRDRIMSKPYLRGLPLVIWDGSPNTVSGTNLTVGELMTVAQAIWDWKGDGRVLFIPSLAVPNPTAASSPVQSAQATLMAQYRDALIAAFGAAHVWSAVPTLQALATASTDDQNDVAAGLVPRSIMLTQNAAEVHLSDAAMTAVANAATLQAKINGL